MKVIHVLNHFLPAQVAGTEVYAYYLAKHMFASGMDVKILIPNYGKKENDNYTYHSIPVLQYAEPSRIDKALIMGNRIPDGLSAFSSVLESEKAQIVHFHELAGSNGITIRHVEVAKKTGARVVMTFHLASQSCLTGTLMYKNRVLCGGKISVKRCGECYLSSKGYSNLAPFLIPVSSLLKTFSLDTTGWNNRMGTALGTSFIITGVEERLLTLNSLCDSMVVLADWYRDILEKNGIDSSKITLIPQGLPGDSSIVIKNGKRKHSAPLKLVFLGRISPFKGLHLLLDAVGKFDSDRISLDIYGQSNDVDYEKECRQISAGKDNIRWLGKLEPEMVAKVLAGYDVLCLCSTFSEMSPLVIQEAFAAGLPVLASDVYGNAEQVKHGVNGLLFHFMDVDSLSRQIQSLINDPALLGRLVSNLPRVRPFSDVCKSYMDLYQNISGLKMPVIS